MVYCKLYNRILSCIKEMYTDEVSCIEGGEGEEEGKKKKKTPVGSMKNNKPSLNLKSDNLKDLHPCYLHHQILRICKSADTLRPKIGV